MVTGDHQGAGIVKDKSDQVETEGGGRHGTSEMGAINVEGDTEAGSCLDTTLSSWLLPATPVEGRTGHL